MTNHGKHTFIHPPVCLHIVPCHYIHMAYTQIQECLCRKGYRSSILSCRHHLCRHRGSPLHSNIHPSKLQRWRNNPYLKGLPQQTLHITPHVCTPHHLSRILNNNPPSSTLQQINSSCETVSTVSSLLKTH